MRGGISTKAALGSALTAAALAASAIMAQPVKSWLADRGLERFSSAHYEIRYPGASFTGPSIRALAAERESILNSAAARLGTSLNSVHLKIILYADFPSERRATQSHPPYRVVGTTIRAALTGYFHELDPAADAAALLYATWGKPASPLVGDWMARWLAGEWRGRSVDAWAAQMESEVGHHAIRQLYEGVPDGELSPDVNQMLGAAWIDWAYSRGGLAAVRKLYEGPAGPLGYEKAPAALGLAPNDLEAGWRDWLARLASIYPPHALATHTSPENFFFRGISFEDALSLDGGYSSPAAAGQLHALHQLGANAIALVPYGFVDNANGGTVSYTRTGETDEGVSEAAYEAHQLGMRVMLKPQLWVRWGQFTGQIHFDGEAARKRWLRSYREFILHYARLAELEQIDLLCIGNELEGVTGDEAAWRALIAEIRRVYHGPLTYAANWGKEFFSVHFWDALDYAGLNNYYPLAPKPSAQADDLREGAKALAAKLDAFHAQWHKPILFTEVGYPSVRGAAVEPWVEDADRATNSEEQAAAYEAVFREFPARPWFAGMFWWKWRSDGSGGGPEDGSYSPIGKPAAEIIRSWYTRIASSPPKRP
jgi:glycosyl hydrolase family 113